MGAAHFLKPAGRLGRHGEIEQPGADDGFQRDVGETRLIDLRPRIKPRQHIAHACFFVGIDRIDLVQHEHIGKLHLVDQQLGDASLVPLARLQPSILEPFDRPQLFKESAGIHHRHHGVQPRPFR